MDPGLESAGAEARPDHPPRRGSRGRGGPARGGPPAGRAVRPDRDAAPRGQRLPRGRAPPRREREDRGPRRGQAARRAVGGDPALGGGRVRRLTAAASAAVVGALALAVACGPKVRPDYPEPEDDGDDPMALMPDAGPPVARPEPVAPRERRAAGEVTRAEVNGILERGIGAFLAGIDVEPAFSNDKFSGWEIVAFWPDEPRFAG